MTRTRPIAVLLAAAMAAGLPVAALAQGNPSSDQIINSLRPGVGFGGGTRGLRPGAPAAPATPPPAEATPPRAAAVVPHTPPSAPGRPTPPPPPTEAAASKPSVNLTVQFRSGSADLSPEAIHTLDELGRALSSSALAGFRFRIEGHTDTVGTREANKSLSERRAQTVVDYLSGHFQVDRARLQAVGMGEEGLLIPTGDQVGEPRNRRVLVVNLGA
jgi:outer membrane protein OmpA-like peptidoglycan-associated protein